MQKHRLLYVYEERIPQNLRELVLTLIPKDEFEIDSMTYALPDAEKVKKLQWAEVVLFAPGRHLPDEIFSQCRNIKLMQLWSSGYDKFNIAGAAKAGIPVANNGGANAISVSEHTVLLMLSVYKWIHDSHHRTVTGTWAGNSHGMDMFLLHKKTVGLIGFGNIGRNVAKRLAGFDTDTIYYDVKRADPETERALHARYVTFDELLHTSDIVSLHLHYNKETEKMIGAKEFDMMKKSAVLINVSRAQLVDKEALYNALKEKRIFGAGMDVYMEEPTRADDPLMQLPNIIATPHMAGSTYDTYFMAIQSSVDNFRRVLNGEKARWVVNGVE
jgi:phosphoglycerate dehydrogenase-like enzyme